MNMKWVLTGSLAVGLAIGLIGVASAQQDAHHTGQTAATTITTTEQAQQQVASYLAKIGLSSLTVGDVLPFENSFYVSIIDPATGNGAFELLVNRTDGGVHPEFGPTMMWNTEYSPMFGAKGNLLRGAMDQDMMGNMTGNGMGSGMMGDMSGSGMDGGMMGNMSSGMMGDGNGMMDQNMSGDGDGMMSQGMTGYEAGASQPLAQLLTADAALSQAQTWLTEQVPNATATGPIAFPGYVTVKIERDGQIVGLVSVQTTTGAIWQHVWHGDIAS